MQMGMINTAYRCAIGVALAAALAQALVTLIALIARLGLPWSAPA